MIEPGQGHDKDFGDTGQVAESKARIGQLAFRKTVIDGLLDDRADFLFGTRRLRTGTCFNVIGEHQQSRLAGARPRARITEFGRIDAGRIAAGGQDNLVIAILLTPVMNMLGSKSEDQTAPADYYA